jgi:hypothetical protein
MPLRPAATAAILLGLALFLSACGDEETVAAGRVGSSGSEAAAKPSAATGGDGPASKRCGRPLGNFLDSIESLNNSLAVGLSYEQYLSAVNGVRSTYADVRADRLPLGCLARTATPAERALNTYIDAANTWGDCLASASCDTADVESELRRRWAQASASLEAATDGYSSISGVSG